MKMPYTEALLSSIPKIAEPSHTRLADDPGPAARPRRTRRRAAGSRARCAYVQDRCREEEPPLLDGNEPGHEYRCWFPVGTPEGNEALGRRNRGRRADGARARREPGAS